MGKTYKKLYEEVHGKIETGNDIHHIDWNHENNDISNMISIPKKIHKLVHKYWGYVSREEFEKVLEAYKKIANRDNCSIGYLNTQLSKYVDTKKKDLLSIKCRVSIEYDITRYQSSFNWRDGKGGMQL
jgi:hypothetical protein